MNKTLEITTKIGCDNYCVYCPQRKLMNSYVGNIFMTYIGFRAILDNVPKDVQIDFTGFCEPFLNPDAAWMMKYAIDKGYQVVMITTLTGFTERDAFILKDSVFKEVLIHEFEGVAINMDVFEAKEALLRRYVKGDIKRFKLTEEFRWSRAGNLWGREKKKGPFKCGWTGLKFDRNVVLPNGNVYICCMDYSLKHCIGNLFEKHYDKLNRKSLVDLANSEESECICRKCEIVC